ncbi:amidohydrolase family protein [Sandaracinobacter sp. RS1-74]|uniref:amidohydrolase family protein n=1 Tax=Sandaracinobacteroides sayramensis TaxID=2913411 RepID=UPI001EDB5C72|nr:amidohydrolase family protein [Sandaracinobacteroides sayramensis]MCG2841020.1 amidohydrolase family protein [Sandaracinobacteroides sayramensis]
MRKLLLALLLAASSQAVAQQERIAITGGKVVTNGGAPIEGGVVLISGGSVERVGPAGTAVPAGYRVIDANGKWVTPGIIAGLSQFGAVEVSGVSSSNDLSARQSPATAALMLEGAFNPNETSIPVGRIEGVTAAIVGPSPGRSLFAGQGYVLSLADGTTEPLRPRAFQYLVYGERGASLAGGSRPAAWIEITNALEEAQRLLKGGAPSRDQSRDLRLAPEDAQALTLVLRGAQPLLVRAERASDIRQVLKLPRMYPGIRLVLVSANEGWLVADEIARAGVPVITLGMNNRPDSFEAIGSTMSNVGRLAAAGVKVALGVPDLDVSFQPRNLPHYAGNMVAQARLPGGVGLSWDQAFAAISRTPAEIFGLSDMGVLKPGAAADVVVWSGDPLELTTHAEQVIIRGVPQSLESRQTQLARRYQPGRERTQLPEAYSR